MLPPTWIMNYGVLLHLHSLILHVIAKRISRETQDLEEYCEGEPLNGNGNPNPLLSASRPGVPHGWLELSKSARYSHSDWVQHSEAGKWSGKKVIRVSYRRLNLGIPMRSGKPPFNVVDFHHFRTCTHLALPVKHYVQKVQLDSIRTFLSTPAA